MSLKAQQVPDLVFVPCLCLCGTPGIDLFRSPVHRSCCNDYDDEINEINQPYSTTHAVTAIHTSAKEPPGLKGLAPLSITIY